jgi:hypothetical protein
MRTIINIVLTIAVILLAILLVQTIAEPIQFQKAKKYRYKAVQERLKKIKETQFAYKNLRGEFASNFDELLSSIHNDTFQIVRVLGNPDDTAQTITRDTTHLSFRDSLFTPDYAIDSLPYIPFSRGQKFTMDADKITKGKVEVPVFEVKAPDTAFLYDQPQQFVERDHALKIGSMTEPNYAANWE